VRDELVAEEPPRDGCEWLLIDQVAQFQTVCLVWQEEVMARSAGLDAGSRNPGRTEEQVLYDLHAQEQAMRMLERWHGIFLRSLKALQHTRRGRPMVIVRRTPNVNAARKLVNLNTAGR